MFAKPSPLAVIHTLYFQNKRYLKETSNIMLFNLHSHWNYFISFQINDYFFNNGNKKIIWIYESLPYSNSIQFMLFIIAATTKIVSVSNIN